MKDGTWQRDEPTSPCVRVCVMDDRAGLCIGCLRTLDEIAAWSRMDDAERLGIMAALPDRAPRLTQRRGGRRGRTDG